MSSLVKKKKFRISTMDYQQGGSTKKFKKPSKNDRNTLNKIEDKRTLKASLVDWKDQEHPSANWKSLRKLPCESRSLTKSLVSYRINKFLPSIMEDSPMGPRHKENSLEGCEERNFPKELRKLLGEQNQHKLPQFPNKSWRRRREFSPMDYTL